MKNTIKTLDMLSKAFELDIPETNIEVDGKIVKFKESKLAELLNEDMEFKQMFFEKYAKPLQARLDKVKDIEIADSQKVRVDAIKQERDDMISVGSRLEHLIREFHKFAIIHAYFIAVTRGFYKDLSAYGVVKKDGSCGITKRVFGEQKEMIEKHYSHLKDLVEYYEPEKKEK